MIGIIGVIGAMVGMLALSAFLTIVLWAATALAGMVAERDDDE